jgi:hypothetical protein
VAQSFFRVIPFRVFRVFRGEPCFIFPVLILSSSDLFDRSLFQRLMNHRARRDDEFLCVPLRTLRLNLTDRESPFATRLFPLRLCVIPFLRGHAAEDVDEEFSLQGAKEFVAVGLDERLDGQD